MRIPASKVAALLSLSAALGMGVACVHNAGTEAAATAPDPFGQLSVTQVQALIAKHAAAIFDNNSREDYAKGHVPTATWLAFNDVKASELPADRSRTLVFYCHNEH